LSKLPPLLLPIARCRQTLIEQAESGALKTLVDTILPPRCGGCDDWHDGVFCPFCEPQLRLLQAPVCACCGLPFDAGAKVLCTSLCAACRANRYHGAPPIEAMRSIYAFDGPVRDAVHRFKYRGRTSLARPLAELLWQGWQTPLASAIPRDIDWITPVPLQAWRKWRRGYNQSELLADELSRFCARPALKVLWRRRHTRSQTAFSARDRQGNVRDAFAIDPTEIAARELSGRSILLLDDVCTTGATIYECARVLKQNGAKAVYALTLARQL